MKIDQYNITEWSKNRVNFWGITKNANTSVKMALLEEDRELHPKKSYAWVHNPKIGKYITPEAAFKNGFTNFTLVRDPITRVQSMYKDIVIKRNKKLSVAKKFNLHETMSFDEFLDFLQVHMYDNIHFCPQTFFIVKNDTVLPEKIFKLEEINNLEKFLNLTIPTTNSTRKKFVEEEPLTKKQIQKIKILYQNDFKILNY
jgi:hypothetical protein